MSTSPIASYFAELGIRVNQRQFKQADATLQRMQASMEKLKAQFNQSLAINPKIQFNSLQFQRQIQKSLNQISRLTEFRMDRFNVDASRLTSSLQSAIRRAEYGAGSLRVKAIVERSSVSQGARAVAGQPHAGYAGTGGIGGLVGAGRAGIAGIASYAGYEAIQGLQNQMDQIQQNVGKFEQQRLQLGASVGGSAERRWNNAVALRNIADYTGTKAEDQIAGYTKFEKQAMQSGMKARQAINLYTDMAVSTRGNGGDQQSIERQAYALQQVLGLGYLRGEELNQQLADSNPAIKKYIQSAYLQRVGFKGTESEGTAKFMTDLGKRLVLVQDVLKGYDLSARNAAPRVEELSNSIEGAAARLDNVKWMENLERAEGPLTDAVRRRIEAEQNLYKATIPLQEQFIKLVQIPFVDKLTEFTNGLAGFASWVDKFQKTPDDQKTKLALDTIKEKGPGAVDYYADNHPGLQAVGWLWENHPTLKLVKDGAESLYNTIKGPSWGDPGNRIVPNFLPYQQPKLSYQTPLNEFQTPAALPWIPPVQFGENPIVNTPSTADLIQSMQQNYQSHNTTNVDNHLVIENGAIQINGTNLSVDELGSELEIRMGDIARRMQENAWSDTMIQYPHIGR